MNQICSWDRPFLSRKVEECEKKIRFLEILSKIARVGLSLLALGFLTAFGLLNPSYLHISSTLLLVAYHPSLEVTVGTLDRWVEATKKNQAKYRAILAAYTQDRSPIEAQIAALEGKKDPQAEVELAYLRFIQENPTDLRSLSDFGIFVPLTNKNPLCQCPSPIFKTTGGELFSGNYAEIFSLK